jgi:hypothetical protein
MELTRWEAMIESNTAFDEVGTGFQRIRDGRLYRATHDTFEAYCRERWKLRKRYVNRQIKAAVVADNLRSLGVKASHEEQLRPLALLPREDQRTVWAEAVELSAGQQPAATTVETLARHARMERREQTALRRSNRRRKEGASVREVVDAIEVLSQPSPNVQDDASTFSIWDEDDGGFQRRVEDTLGYLTLLLKELQANDQVVAEIEQAGLFGARVSSDLLQ